MIIMLKRQASHPVRDKLFLHNITWSTHYTSYMLKLSYMLKVRAAHPSDTNFFSHLLEANWLPPLRPCEYSWTKKEAQKGVIFLLVQNISVELGKCQFLETFRSIQLQKKKKDSYMTQLVDPCFAVLHIT